MIKARPSIITGKNGQGKTRVFFAIPLAKALINIWATTADYLDEVEETVEV